MISKNLIAYVAFLFLFSHTSFAQTYTWDGGANTNKWEDALNWDSNLVPTASTDVVLTGGVSIEIASAFTIAYAKTVSITGNTTLIINVNAILTLSSSTGTSISISGSALQNFGTINLSNIQKGIELIGATTLLDNHGIVSVVAYTSNALEIGDGCTNCEISNYGQLTFDFGLAGSKAIQIKNASTSIINNYGTIIIGPSLNAGGAIALGIFGGKLDNYGNIEILETGLNNPGIAHGFIPGTVNNYLGASFTISTGGTIPIGGNNLNLVNDGNIEFGATGSMNLILSGTGSFSGVGPYSNSNSISPGHSPGCLSFEDYFQTGPTNIELGGTIACSEFDQINVTNDATITGTLNVSFVNGFIPTNGQSFKVLNIGNTRTGTYTNINLPSAPGLTWSTAYDATGLELTASVSLPVEMISFDAQLRNQHVHLNWMTASEINNNGFSIERSSDNRTWAALGFIEGKGDSAIKNEYSFKDTNPIPGENYYRLKQIDFDGQMEYSDVINVQYDLNGDIQIFPNPVTDVLYLKTSELDNELALRILNLQGGEIARPLLVDSKIEVSNLEKGIYLLEINDGTRLHIQRFVVQ